MGLLDLVKEHYRVRATADRFGQLATLIVPNIAGGRTKQAGHRVPFLILTHVDAHNVLVIIEEELGHRARQFGLAHPGWPEEDKAANRSVGILQPSATAANRGCHDLHGLLLANDAVVKDPFHA